MRAVLSIFGLVLLASIAHPATIYVPDNYAKIQDAINASVNGDTIIVRPGTYLENINFNGKEVVVRSEQGYSSTVIDGRFLGTVVQFHNGEGSGAVLEGFTIVNGKNVNGGGISCVGAVSPNIIGNSIVKNEAVGAYNESKGGGIYIVDGASPHLTSNVIAENEAISGGGIYCENQSSPVIIGNLLIRNVCTGWTTRGGGVYCRLCDPVIQDCDFWFNRANDGGGMYIAGGLTPIISSCSFIENVGTDWGGGALTDSNNSRFVNCLYYKNRAGSTGGGVLVIGNAPQFHNCSFISNYAKSTGGAISSSTGCNFKAVNCTVYKNTAPFGGGGIFHNSGFPEITNCILREDYPDEIMDMNNCQVTYSCVQGGWPGVGNLSANSDPLFSDPANEDFHLTWLSPCRNTGDNTAVTELYDFEGDPRIALGTVDMGADEFYYHLYKIGDVLPGAPIAVKVVGDPGSSAMLALGNGIQDPPQSTPHGDLWLSLPLAMSWQLGAIPGTGILTMPATVPAGWPSGSRHPFQALVGPWGGGATRLTNLMELTVK
jgi:predicted outer membrane repeat protein